MATSYSNPGGTGDRTSIITVTFSPGLIGSGTPDNLVDGATGSNSTDSCDFSAGSTADAWVKFDFGSNKIIDEVTWRQNNSLTHGIWQWQASLDDVNWVPITVTFTVGGAPQVQNLSMNTLGYRYYRLYGFSGTRSTSPWITEVEFKIDDGPDPVETSRFEGSPGCGDRTGDITVTVGGITLGGGTPSNLVDGAWTDNISDAIWINFVTLDGDEFIRFEFDQPYVIDDAMSFRTHTNSLGTWQWRGSNDAVSWTNIGAPFALGGTLRYQRHPELGGNTTAYKYYELRGVSGSVSNTPWTLEWTFRWQQGEAATGVAAELDAGVTVSVNLLAQSAKKRIVACIIS